MSSKPTCPGWPPALASRLAADGEARVALTEALSDEPALDALLVAEESYVPRARWRTTRLVA